jgi:hypothetical protein
VPLTNSTAQATISFIVQGIVVPKGRDSNNVLRLYKVIAIVLIKLTLNFLIETSYDLSNIYIFDTRGCTINGVDTDR